MTPASTTQPADWFTPAIDPLAGARPTWRPGDEPIYLETVRDLGLPGRLLGPAPRDVVAGELADGPVTASLTLVTTQPLDVVAAPAPRKPRARKRTAS